MPGVYLCGAATHPGGSVIGINGRNAAMAVLKDVNQRFSFCCPRWFCYAAPYMADHPALKRGIRFRDLVLFYVVVVLSVRWTATAATAGPSILIVWLAALFCFFIPLAASVMELSSRYPEEGGIYVWTREAFGDFAGFICAWAYWMSNLPFFAGVLYFGAASALFVFGPRAQRSTAIRFTTSPSRFSGSPSLRCSTFAESTQENG